MASGIARSPWLSLLAEQLGMRPGKLRGILSRNGYEAPFLDEARAIRILHKEGYQKATATGVTKEARFLTTEERKAAIRAPSKPRPQQTAAEKRSSIWSMKLVPRLARLLPEGDSDAGKKRVKKILRRGGYEGPRWKDQSRALAIFRAANISVEGFEYEEENTGTGTEVVLADSPVQMTLLPKASAPGGANFGRRTAGDASGVMGHAECLNLLGYVFTMLTKYERDVFAQIRAGQISKLCAPLEVPIVVLNELRPKVKVG